MIFVKLSNNVSILSHVDIMVIKLILL